MDESELERALGRYQRAFILPDADHREKAPIIGDLNRWFIEARIIKSGDRVIIHNPQWMFSLEMSETIVGLSGALKRGIAASDIVARRAEYDIAINSGASPAGDAAHTIVYKLQDGVEAGKWEEFILFLQQKLKEQHQERLGVVAAPGAAR